VSLARLQGLGLSLDADRHPPLEGLKDNGLIEVTPTQLRATQSGRLVLDQIIAALLT